MKFRKIDPRKEYLKKLARGEDEKLLDVIFDNRWFPRTIYFPLAAQAVGGYLTLLRGDVVRLSMLCYGDVNLFGELPVRERILTQMRRYSFGGDVVLRNQDQIYQEKQTVIMAPNAHKSNSYAEKELATLYPNETCHYLAFDAVTIGGEGYYVLLQAGFLQKHTYCLKDTLPEFSTKLLPGEKSLLFPGFEKILLDMGYMDSIGSVKYFMKGYEK